MFSSLTESADPVKVLTAAQVNYSFHILAVGRNGARGGAGSVYVPSRDISLSEIAPAQLFHVVIGERERANLVVHLAAIFLYIYIYICIWVYI